MPFWTITCVTGCLPGAPGLALFETRDNMEAMNT
jgi:hypothetical protein